MNKKMYFNVFKNLVHSDLLAFKEVFIDKLIDMGIWVVLTLVVMGYIMPYFGLKSDFGPVQLGGVVATVGLFELYGSVMYFVSDLEGNRIVNYSLTLPAQSWIALISKATYYAIIYVVLSLFMIPIGKLVLWNQLDMATISFSKLLLAIVCSNIFFACFTIWCSSIIKNLQNIGAVWARYIFPMWFMGGFQFSWLSLLSALPWVAYISLLNPMIYITECTRSAMLGPVGYMNYWICIGAILAFSFISLVVGIYNLKKRLDYV